MQQIILFGGTFDPPHLGHTNLLKTVKKHFPKGSLIVVPSNNPPLRSNEPSTGFADRLSMTKIAFSKIVDKIDGGQKTNKNISYTYQIIKDYQNKYKDAKLYFVVGSDRANDFNKWKNWKFIESNCQILVVDRVLQSVKHNNFIYLPNKPIVCNSTQFRKDPADCWKFIDKDVAKYIVNNNVYALQWAKQFIQGEERFSHTTRVLQTIRQIAPKRILQKAETAAIYHDLCKHYNEKDLLRLCQKNSKKDVSKLYPSIHCLHGYGSAIIAEQRFGVCDKEILLAISFHVIPNDNPSLLTKLLYLADKLEPARTTKDIPNRQALLALAKKDIDKAFQKVLAITLSHYKN